jgi:predicted short-subunit dehydrogenase-like oxidoreductase (DUF2520 family)
VKAQNSTVKNARLHADLIWFSVPDREIARVAAQLANRVSWKGKIALHCSGALASDELGKLRDRGASVASVHPLMTFVAGSVPPLEGVAFAVEGDRVATNLARRIVRQLGGVPFPIGKQNKAAYHAWGGFTSPLLVAALAAGEQVARLAGLTPASARKKMLPIVAQTLANYARYGPAGAFSGPLVRGDAAVVRSHLRALRRLPAARKTYLALAKSALLTLPVQNRKELGKVLGE